MKRDLPLSDACDLVDGHEQVTALYSHHRTRDRRVGAFSHPYDQVLNPADGLTLGIEQGPLDQARQVNEMNRALDFRFARGPAHVSRLSGAQSGCDPPATLP